jgi:hypothetical protein
MMNIFKKTLSKKKYIAFLFVVPVLAVTALIDVDCPVCDGRGVITGFPAMENVALTDIESREVDTIRDACTSFIMYNYDVTISLTNEGQETAVGFIKMILLDFTEGKLLDTKYTVVEIAGETTLDIAYNIWFESGLDEELRTLVNAEVLVGDVPDVTCEGTGRISLNTWPLINQLKNSFIEVARSEKPFAKPAGWQWEEHVWEDE